MREYTGSQHEEKAEFCIIQRPRTTAQKPGKRKFPVCLGDGEIASQQSYQHGVVSSPGEFCNLQRFVVHMKKLKSAQ